MADIFDVKKYLQELTPAVKALFSEVVLLMKLILVLPATNATSERSFSAMRSVKSHLRSTMGQERLNNLMVLHVHKEYTDKIVLIKTLQMSLSRNVQDDRVYLGFNM